MFNGKSSINGTFSTANNVSLSAFWKHQLLVEPPISCANHQPNGSLRKSPLYPRHSPTIISFQIVKYEKISISHYIQSLYIVIIYIYILIIVIICIYIYIIRDITAIWVCLEMVYTHKWLFKRGKQVLDHWNWG